MDQAEHWNRVYRTKSGNDVSWFEPVPQISIDLLTDAGLTAETCVLDVGGGDSRLVDALVARGLQCISVLDISGAALERARARLGISAAHVTWIEADVTGEWTSKQVDLWHDRAVFHFLTRAEERERYKRRLTTTLRPGASAVIATFAPEGPSQCSGLPVQRYSPEELATELGNRFELRESRAHLHTTPSGRLQPFQYSWFQRVD